MRIHPSQTCIKQRDLNTRDHPRANEKTAMNQHAKILNSPQSSDAWIAIMIGGWRGSPLLIRLELRYGSGISEP
jgi:hypothetical protein